jgi:limonene-1,2-epoxide hydrolase
MAKPQPYSATNTNTNTNKSAMDVVESFLDALRAKDLERAFALMSDDIEYQNVPFPPYRERAQTERVLRTMARIPGEIGIRIHNIAERDGVVLTERTDSLRSSWLELEFWACGTFEVRNGKITLWRDRFDLSQFAFQCVTAPLRRLLRARTRPSAQ